MTGERRPPGGEPSWAVLAAGRPARQKPLRDRARRTLRRLMDAGLESFAEHGYHAARVDDIVRRAETSHGTFYLYFDDKEDLLRTLAAECAETMTRMVDGLGEIDGGPDGYVRLREWLAEFIGVYRAYGPVIRAWLEDHANDPLLLALGNDMFGDVAARFAGPLEQGGASHLPDASASAVAFIAMIERFSYFLTSRELPFDDEATLDTLAVLVHRGFLGGSPPSPAARRVTP